MGFEGRVCVKVVVKKEKVFLLFLIGFCYLVVVFKGKDVFFRNLSGSYKGLFRQKRSVSDVVSFFVFFLVIKRDEVDGNVFKEEYLIENVQDFFQKDDKVERKEEFRKLNGEVLKCFFCSYEGDGENNLKDLGDKEGVDFKSQIILDYF